MALFEDTFPPHVRFGSRTLRLETPNLKGTDVAVFQANYNLMLTAMNPPLGPMGSPVKIDGVYGPNSQLAAKNIQSYFGLSVVDGIVGDDTYFIFGQGVGSHMTYGGPVYGSRSLSPGMSGGDVTILQNRLNCFRYAQLIGHPGDDNFDSATGNALLAFKADAVLNGDTGLSADTTVGDGAFDASWLYTFAGGRAIETGRNGFDVVFLQIVLKNLGFYSGRITGYYDAATRSAVVAFQQVAGISADGVVGPDTFYQIGRRNRVAAPKPLRIAWPVESAAAPPSAGISDCCVALSPLVVPGGIVWARQGPGDSRTLMVMAMNLPDPQSFGPDNDRYWYAVEGPSYLVSRPMSKEFSGLGVWSAVNTDIFLPFPSSPRIVISPGDANSRSQPNVLMGSMADCEQNTAGMLNPSDNG